MADRRHLQSDFRPERLRKPLCAIVVLLLLPLLEALGETKDSYREIGDLSCQSCTYAWWLLHERTELRCSFGGDESPDTYAATIWRNGLLFKAKATLDLKVFTVAKAAKTDPGRGALKGDYSGSSFGIGGAVAGFQLEGFKRVDGQFALHERADLETGSFGLEVAIDTLALHPVTELSCPKQRP